MKNANKSRKERIANFREEAILIAQSNLFGELKNEAEDAAHESLLQALEKEHTYQGCPEKLNHWLGKIVKNKCKDIARKKREKLLPSDWLISEKSWCGNQNSLDTENGGKTLAKERRRTLRKLVHSMPDGKSKKIFLLRNTFRCSGEEISNYVNMTRTAVDVNFKRTKDKLTKTVMNCKIG